MMEVRGCSALAYFAGLALMISLHGCGGGDGDSSATITTTSPKPSDSEQHQLHSDPKGNGSAPPSPRHSGSEPHPAPKGIGVIGVYVYHRMHAHPMSFKLSTGMPEEGSWVQRPDPQKDWRSGDVISFTKLNQGASGGLETPARGAMKIEFDNGHICELRYSYSATEPATVTADSTCGRSEAGVNVVRAVIHPTLQHRLEFSVDAAPPSPKSSGSEPRLAPKGAGVIGVYVYHRMHTHPMNFELSTGTPEEGSWVQRPAPSKDWRSGDVIRFEELNQGASGGLQTPASGVMKMKFDNGYICQLFFSHPWPAEASTVTAGSNCGSNDAGVNVVRAIVQPGLMILGMPSSFHIEFSVDAAPPSPTLI